MRCLVFNTEEIEFIVGQPSNRPKNVDNIPSTTENNRFERITLALLCVELGDTKEDALVILREIERYYKDHKLQVLVVPFVHLSSAIEESSQTAYGYVNYISKELKKNNMSVQGMVSFGYDCAFIAKWITILHKGNVAFRDSRFNI